MLTRSLSDAAKMGLRQPSMIDGYLGFDGETQQAIEGAQQVAQAAARQNPRNSFGSFEHAPDGTISESERVQRRNIQRGFLQAYFDKLKGM